MPKFTPEGHAKPITWGHLKEVRDRAADPGSTTKTQLATDVIRLHREVHHLMNLLHEQIGVGTFCREQIKLMYCLRCADYEEGINNFVGQLRRRHRDGTCTCYDGNPSDAIAFPDPAELLADHSMPSDTKIETQGALETERDAIKAGSGTLDRVTIRQHMKKKDTVEDS